MTHSDPAPPVSRRDLLQRLGSGFGTLAAASMFDGTMHAGRPQLDIGPSPLSPKLPHFAPKAKHVIQLFMPGGPSQVDTFDYKPLIKKHAGERPSTVDRKTLRNTKNGLFPSPFGFKQYGQSGKWGERYFSAHRKVR